MSSDNQRALDTAEVLMHYVTAREGRKASREAMISARKILLRGNVDAKSVAATLGLTEMAIHMQIAVAKKEAEAQK